uniref:Uncharacterized protein n=1 Tax=Entomoneis paludosa TaxID=265537 RepID=A0A7S2YLI6_9STRA|mmetsp:Transcript_37543/g.77902  ORF Transcript_37543/g.77902 Transcript_37543/m.77902 type:complete len:329 (+) Transcript_37543:48-1034(+)
MGKKSRKGTHSGAAHVHHKTGEGTHHHHHLHEGPLYQKYHHHHTKHPNGADGQEQQQQQDTITEMSSSSIDALLIPPTSPPPPPTAQSSLLAAAIDVLDRTLDLTVAPKPPNDNTTTPDDDDHRSGMDEDDDQDERSVDSNEDIEAQLADASLLMEHESDAMAEPSSSTRYIRLASSSEDDDDEEDHEDEEPLPTNTRCLKFLQHPDTLWIVGLTAALETLTCVLRFGFHWESTRDTASTVSQWTGGLRIHHGYVGILMLLGYYGWHKRRRTSRRNPPEPSEEEEEPRIWPVVLYRLGWALIFSDLMHHFLVLWPITGSPHFDFFYPS